MLSLENEAMANLQRRRDLVAAKRRTAAACSEVTLNEMFVKFRQRQNSCTTSSCPGEDPSTLFIPNVPPDIQEDLEALIVEMDSKLISYKFRLLSGPVGDKSNDDIIGVEDMGYVRVTFETPNDASKVRNKLHKKPPYHFDVLYGQKRLSNERDTRFRSGPLCNGQLPGVKEEEFALPSSLSVALGGQREQRKCDPQTNSMERRSSEHGLYLRMQNIARDVKREEFSARKLTKTCDNVIRETKGKSVLEEALSRVPPGRLFKVLPTVGAHCSSCIAKKLSPDGGRVVAYKISHVHYIISSKTIVEPGCFTTGKTSR